MFSLSDTDLEGRILGCGDGPASFNAEATHQGARVTSIDPLYASTHMAIRERIAATFDGMLEETRRNADEFVWSSIGSVEELGQTRHSAMQTFLGDYDVGREQGRYVNAKLPLLPFDNASFDLALCGHFLSLYSLHFDQAFHLSAIQEMCRVAKEVRVFPLLALGGRRSPFVDPCADELDRSGFDVTIVDVPYEFQHGGNQMMRIRPAHDV